MCTQSKKELQEIATQINIEEKKLTDPNSPSGGTIETSLSNFLDECKEIFISFQNGTYSFKIPFTFCYLNISHSILL
jgi:hypothetical protein